MATTRAQHEPEAVATPYATPNAERLVDAVERIWLCEGDLALNVRRLLKDAEVTNRDLYLSFRSRDGLLEHVASLLADHVQDWVSLPTGMGYLEAALRRPAAWRALLLGHGPLGLPVGPERLSSVRSVLSERVGGDAELAKLDGIVTAVLAGRLHRVALSGLAAAGVDPLEV